MDILFISRTSKDPGTAIENKAIERYREEAMKEAKEFLCPDCLDQRCRTGSPCNALLVLTDGIAWEKAAGKAEMN